jgi:hypothetical protein
MRRSAVRSRSAPPTANPRDVGIFGRLLKWRRASFWPTRPATRPYVGGRALYGGGTHAERDVLKRDADACSVRRVPAAEIESDVIEQRLLRPLSRHAIFAESPIARAAKTRAQTPALLKGLLFGPTGRAMTPTHTRKGGKLYRYYVSTCAVCCGRLR